jgi:WD40 repeat protein
VALLSAIPFLSCPVAQGQEPKAPPKTPLIAKADRTDAQGDPLPRGALARLGTTRFRTGQFINAIALSPDGKLFAMPTFQGIEMLDAATGKQLLTAKGQPAGRFVPGGLSQLAFSPDGKMLAGVGFSGMVTLFGLDGNVRSQLQVQAQPGQFVQLTALALSGNGKILAAGGTGGIQNGKVYIWEVANNKLLASVEVIHNNQIGVALSGDGKLLATWGQYFPRGAFQPNPDQPRTMQLWDTTTGKELRQVKLEGTAQANISGAALSPDGKVLALRSGLATIRIWDVDAGKELHRFAARRSYGVGGLLRFSPDGKVLAVGVTEAVLLWHTATWKRLAGSRGPAGSTVSSLAFVNKDRILACGISGQTVSVWEVLSGKVLSPDGGHRLGITALAFSGDGQSLLSASSDGKVCRWEAASGKELGHFFLKDDDTQRFVGGAQPNRLVALAPGGRFAATEEGFGAAGVRLWETKPLQVLCDLDGPNTTGQGSLAFSLRGNRLAATSGMDKTVYVWDTTTGEELRRLTTEQSIPIGPSTGRLALSPDGELLAASIMHNVPQGGLVGKVYLWRLATGKEVCTIGQGNGQAPSLAFSADGRNLATATGQGVILWETTSGKELRRLEGAGGAGCLVFSPDGRTLAGGSNGPAGFPVHMWEVASGGLRATFTDGHRAMISSLAFSADGRLLASGSADTTALVWDAGGRFLVQAGVEHQPADLWNDLGSANAVTAFQAVSELVGRPKVALTLLKERLQPIEGKTLGQEEIRKLIADLDSPRFAVREKANRALEKLGKAAGPELTRALKQAPTPELQRRIDKLLSKLDQLVLPPEELRGQRGVEVLERVGSPEARAFLEALSRGAQGHTLTDQAQAALTRLRTNE